MRRPGGFTLVEVMVGIVVTSVVALLVYGAMSTAADTQARLARGWAAERGEMAWRAIVDDLTRSVRARGDDDEPTLVVQDGRDRDGRPADRLVLVTAAGTPPLASGADWRVAVESGPDGLVAVAVPLGRTAPARTLWAPDDLTGMDVQALAGGLWLDAWAGGPRLPEALRITFWTEAGPKGVPLVVALPVGGGP